ncbi:MAG TPA: hypothetical protein VMT24_14540 [Aggregatilineaceae bacterium]|jgi:hypothetical protein|nr:hypothetical protein [Aggregatilineaceae bacterium]
MSGRGRRFRRALAVGAWLYAVGVFVVQTWVLLDPTANSVRTVFPDWPHDSTYDGYLRGLAWGDVLFAQPLLFVTGIGLWQGRHWAWITGVAIGCTALYFNIFQVSAQLYIRGESSLYGAGIFGAPLDGTFLKGFMDWIGLLPFAGYPLALTVYCTVQLRRHYRTPSSER